MKFSFVCHVVVVVGFLQLLNFSVSATPIHRGDEEHPGPKTEEERKEAYEAFYKGEQTIEYPPNHSSRNVIPSKQKRWTGAKVPYIIDASVAGNMDVINEAIEDYHNNTCIRFVQRKFEPNYIRLFAGQGCNSIVGMSGGEQPVSLGAGCMFKGTVVHELGHALGFYHEFNRSDRDDYLTIYWSNIQSRMESTFQKLKLSENLLLDDFDYNSIMIYGNTAYSKIRILIDGRLDTMTANTGQRLYEPYEKPGLSDSDIKRLNKMYCGA